MTEATVLLRATAAEAAGAKLTVAGLSVLDRAIRQFGRTPHLRAVVATDGVLVMPSTLPPNVEVRQLTATGPEAIEALRAETGATTVVGANVVRPRNVVPHGDLTDGVRVVDETTRVEAEDAVFAQLLRGDLGLIARHLNKKISFRITRHILCRLPVTPNQVTLGAAVVGLLGCLLITRGTYVSLIAGMALAQLQSILDGCDGELARVRFQQTAIGEWLDTFVDDFLNLAIVASLGVGLWRAGRGWPAVAAAASACGMYLFYNVISYRELIRQGAGGELVRIRWKLTRGRNMKTVWGETPASGAGGRTMLAVLALGRRDTFVFGWLLLAILNLTPVALLWAVLAALPCFVIALAQVLLPEPAPAS
ncbi:MAG: CDP-alcohol phosphatidyltransferase family protein [Verrucomicrobiota bacterium]